jgi:hypothetical protein
MIARTMGDESDDAGELPVKLDGASNGEFAPRRLSPRAQQARALALERTAANARRLGMSRRDFLATASGAATVLLSVNDAFAQGEPPGGAFQVAPSAALDVDEALAALGGREFIFDVQTHHMNPQGPWRRPFSLWNIALRAFPQAKCGDGFLDRLFGSIDCFSAQHYVQEMFLDSETDMAVLSFVPSLPEDTPLAIEDAAETRRIVETLEGSHRLLLHGRVHPNIPGEVERMPELAEKWKIAAWKTYTGFGPGGHGYWLDDPKVGIPFIEKGRALGVKVFCVHKGLPLPLQDYEFSRCRDIGAVAKAFPDVTFIVYHSGFETEVAEGPYRADNKRGIDDLITSLRANGIGPGGNVYAELGSTWRNLMSDPTAAAHALGKLLLHVGEDRILWGTDSIWYGSPQDQIQSFRTFQISSELREKHGYPELTPRARAKIFGLNAAVPYRIDVEEVKKRAARDLVGRMREAYAEAPRPRHQSWGPRTRGEFLRHWALFGRRP